ncbi:MAG: hypothetical protein EOP10_00830 [Proteobacteria bacterium]|nr:MAG: hypothetical protein EOP10_00830 [Pseudomonadota bacterium]
MTLPLQLDTQSVNATYDSGSGTSDLIFKYIVRAGQNTPRLGNGIELLGDVLDSTGSPVANLLPVSGSEFSLSQKSAIAVDTILPTVPASLTLASATSTNGSVSLSWDSSVDANFLSHQIELCQDTGCSASCYGLTETTQTAITLSSVADGRYYACVRGQDKAGQKSAWTASISQIFVDQTAPTSPSLVSFSTGISATLSFPVTWTESADDNFVTHDLKLCSANNCSTGCGTVSTSVHSPATFTGVHGSTYYGCVRGRDALGNASPWIASASTVQVQLGATLVNRVSSTTANGIYKEGDTINLTVRFSELVNVVNSGDLQLTLETGSTDRVATYTGGTGTDTLTFSYLVQVGDTSSVLDTQSSSALSLGSTGAINNIGGVAAQLTLPSGTNALNQQKSIMIDTSAPTAPSSIGFAHAALTTLSFQMSWSVSTDPNFQTHNLKLCTASNCSTGCISAATSATSPATMTGVNGTAYYGCVQGQDTLGHVTAWVPSLSTVAVDTTSPTVLSVTSSKTNGTYKAGEVIPVTITFSEPVVVVNGSDLSLQLETGTVDTSAVFSSGGGSASLIFEYTVQAGDTSINLEYKALNSLTLGTAGTIKDPAGNSAVLGLPALAGVSSLGGQKAIVIDTTAPATPVITAPAGATSSSNISVISGTAEANTSVVIKDGSTTLGTVTATGGNFSLTLGSPLSDGAYSLTATATDGVGNVSASTAALGLTVDTIDPADPTTVSFPASTSNTLTFNMSWTASTDAHFSTHNTKICTDSNCSTGCISAGTSAASPKTMTGVNGATYYGCVQGTDTYSHVSNWVASAATITVDTTAPAAPVITAPTSNSTSAITSITGTAEAGSTVTIKNGSTTLGSATATGGNFTYSTTLSDGSYSLTATTADSAGNVSPSSSAVAFIVDTINPAVPTSIGFSAATSTVTSFNMSWSVSTDTNFSTHNTKLCTDSGCSVACVSAGTSATSPKSMSGSDGGIYYGCVQGQDTLGRTSAWTSSLATLTVDTSAPVAPVITTPAANTTAAISAISGTAETGSTVVIKNGVTSLGSVVATGGNFSLTLGTPLSDGTYSFTAQATDVAGNVGTASSALAITVDTINPTSPASVAFAATTSTTTTFNMTWTNSTDTNFTTHNTKICTVSDCTSCTDSGTSTASPKTMTGVNGATYYGCVQGLDSLGRVSPFIASASTIRVDTTVPTVSQIATSTANGSYRVGAAVIPIQITFSEAVNVTGTPTLLLETGTTDQSITYSSGTGTAVLTFNYTVAAGNTSQDLDVESASALALSGGTIKDLAGNNATLTLPIGVEAGSLATLANLKIDTTDPTAPSSVAFGSATTVSLTFSMSWTPSADTNFSTHNTKLCTASDCTSCTSIGTSAASPKTMTGVAGNTYYGCVQGQDSAGGTSAFVASAQTIKVKATPVFAGIGSADVLGSWDDGTAKIQFTFLGFPSNIDKYKIYFSPSSTFASFDLASPIATISAGDANFDSNTTDNKILISVPAPSLADGYYHVRFFDTEGDYTDTNTVVSSQAFVLKGKPGYALIPRRFSGLSYDYFMMRYEASLSGGNYFGTDVINTTESSIAACSHAFHQSGTTFDSTCGTKTNTKSAQSDITLTPATGINWGGAFTACRNASEANALIRLPTPEEWRRAAQWIGNSYNTMWTVYTNNSGNNCRVNQASVANPATSSDCKNNFGIYDSAGNVREWVDSRAVQYSISGASESRFSYGPTIARTLSNGIDNITQRLHTLDPGASGLALTMGADFKMPTEADQKQYGTDVQTWISPTTSDNSTGFRCLGFRSASPPTMAQLALPDEPKFTTADLPASRADWKIPENLYVKDNAWETVAITINGNTTDTVAEGQVEFSWKPWSKSMCDSVGACTGSTFGLVYKLYRFIEPNRISVRTATPWALVGAGSSYGATGNDKQLNPLATDSTGAALFDATTTDGKLIATISNCDATTPANCVFTDNTSASTGFSVSKLYRYTLVVQDASGNSIVPSVQTYRSPYFAGPKIVSTAATFRLEPRYRQAGVFLVDEYYQNNLTAPQIMAYVPMDKSGADHDFFIQKYQAGSYSGTISNNVQNYESTWPVRDVWGAWSPKAAQCHDTISQTGNFSTICGDASSVVNATILQVISKRNVAPIQSIDFGASWKACRNSSFSDGAYTYRLRMPSQLEWTKSADWGDVDFNGSIDQTAHTPNLATTVASREQGTADTSTPRCHTDNSPTSKYNTASTETANCRSRYNVADLVGNGGKWVNDVMYYGVVLDNGVDGINFGGTWGSNYYHDTIDLTRGSPRGTGLGQIVPFNADGNYNDINKISYMWRGALQRDGNAAGRFYFSSDSDSNRTDVDLGLRCGY